MEQSEPELRKSFIQYLGDYISKFRQVGWNHGNNVIYLFIYLFLFCIFFEIYYPFFQLINSKIVVSCNSDGSRNN